MSTCPDEGVLVDIEVGRVATQYREAERFLGYVRGVLTQVEEAARATCAIPSFFDIATSIGDPLTLIGKRMGFPRCHCVCNVSPVFGFACDDGPSFVPIVGFCEDGTWLGCEGTSDLCIADDEVYRAHLYARRYQILGLYDIDSLTAALEAVWGPDAWVVEARGGQVTISPGRALTASETQRLAITLRALPVAPGIQIAIHFDTDPVFGFGAGWGGFCEAPEAAWLCPVLIDPYACS